LIKQCGDEEKINKERDVSHDTEPAVDPVPLEKDENIQLPKAESPEIEIQYDHRFECGLHPRYWCSNLETARKCNALKSCMQQWAQSTIGFKAKELDQKQLTNSQQQQKQLVSQKTCGFCIFVFNKLQTSLQQNATEINIEEYLKGACGLLPGKEESEVCIKAVEAYLPEIYIMIRDNLDAGIICRVLKICSDKYLIPYELTLAKSKADQLAKSNQVKNEENASEKSKTSNEFQIKQLRIKILNEADAVITTPLKTMNSKPIFHLLGSKTERLIPLVC
jgi:hypothetical protein